jgi:hypothetical protein
VEEIVRHEISTVVAEVYSVVLFPVSVRADFEGNRSNASLCLTFQEEFFGEPITLTLLPFLDTEITEFVLATTSTQTSARSSPRQC